MAVELTLASFVLRHKLPTNAPETLTSLLSDFLIADMSIARACEVSRIGSLDLLDLVWVRSRRGFKSTLANLLTTSRHYYQWEFSQALVQAVKRADLAIIHWLLAHFSGCPVSEKVVREAAKGGHLWVLQLLEADNSHSGIQWREKNCAESLTDAAKSGHWELMKWLHERASTEETRVNNYDLLEIAVAQNNLERVKWVISNDFALATIGSWDPCSQSLPGPRRMGNSCRDIALFAEWGFGDSAYIVEVSLPQSVRLGDLDTTRWFLARKEELDEDEVFDDILYVACEEGNLPMVQWLLEHVEYLGQVDGPTDAMHPATKYGKLNVVQWLWEHYSRDPTVTLFKDDNPTDMDTAARNGHMDVLEFLNRIDTNSAKNGV